MIQSVLAAEAGAFTVADVARAVHAKLVRRHPHVFGDVQVNDASEVVTNWEQIKKTEKDDQSLVAGVTAGLPALIATQKLFRKGASIGLEPDLELGRRGARPRRRPIPPTSKRRSARRSPPSSRSGASTTSTRSRRWRVGRVATRTASAAMEQLARRPDVDLAAGARRTRSRSVGTGGYDGVMDQLAALRASVARLDAIVEGFDADGIRAAGVSDGVDRRRRAQSHLGSAAVIMHGPARRRVGRN